MTDGALFGCNVGLPHDSQYSYFKFLDIGRCVMHVVCYILRDSFEIVPWVLHQSFKTMNA